MDTRTDTAVVTSVVEIDPTSPWFPDLVRLLADVDRETVGDAYEPQSVEYHARSWRTPNGRQLGWGVVAGGGLAGVAKAYLPTQDNTHLVELELAVAAAHRGRGHGRALLERVVAAARAEGRDTVVSGTGYRPDPSEAWTLHEQAVADASVSTDRVPDHLGVGFARASGATPVQTEMRSQVRLPVPDPVLEAVEAEAAGRADGYTTRTWTGVPPDDLVDDRAVLAERMSTDPPLGDLDWRPEVWDAARVRETSEDWARRGITVVGAGAVDRSTGRMVAFSEVGRDEREPTIAYQFDTIVDPGHRGRRLGIVVKAANLRAVALAWPEVRRVQTWNALENGPMLRVNRALGFEPVGLYTLWQLVLR
ncbi:GNAT family N-acetyltransferase [Aquipuribacter nitratireducens]|uniref:GNAT family N-acetyltransferase n=1 Tax=Aquipuribacter nitratireducens TaxID=650104 RepID=A0ABW0GNM9_9MICO